MGVHFPPLSLFPNLLFSLDSFFLRAGNGRVLINGQENTSCRRGVALRGFADLSGVLRADGKALRRHVRPCRDARRPAAACTALGERACSFPTGLLAIQLLSCSKQHRVRSEDGCQLLWTAFQIKGEFKSFINC